MKSFKLLDFDLILDPKTVNLYVLCAGRRLAATATTAGRCAPRAAHFSAVQCSPDAMKYFVV